MSFLYPRTISITRPAAQVGVGAIGYGGQAAATETSVASGLPATIQLKKEGKAPDAHLPGDISKRTLWRIMIPLQSAALGLIKDRDIVTDDLGLRYQVMAPYFSSLGYDILAERLET